MTLPDDFTGIYASARAGGDEARDDLARRFTTELEQYVDRHSGKDVRRRVATEDICQNALLTFFQRIDGFPPELTERELLSYLLKIAGWKIGDVMKRKDVVQGESAAAAFEPSAEIPTQGPVTKADDRRHLADLIGRLRESYRVVLEYTVLEGLGIPETAARLGVEQATVRQRISRARRELQELTESRRSEGRESRE